VAEKQLLKIGQRFETLQLCDVVALKEEVGEVDEGA
jgi:hypothetical protein